MLLLYNRLIIVFLQSNHLSTLPRSHFIFCFDFIVQSSDSLKMDSPFLNCNPYIYETNISYFRTCGPKPKIWYVQNITPCLEYIKHCVLQLPTIYRRDWWVSQDQTLLLETVLLCFACLPEVFVTLELLLRLSIDKNWLIENRMRCLTMRDIRNFEHFDNRNRS